MAFLFINKIRETEYIYGGVSHRNAETRIPYRESICLGKIDPKTRKAVFNDNYSTWIEKFGDSLDQTLEDYAKKRNITIYIDKEIEPNHNLDVKNLDEVNDNTIKNVDTAKKIFSIDDVSLFNTKYYGSTYLLKNIAKKIGLYDIIVECFPTNYNQILTIMLFYVIEPDPLMYCKYFSEYYETSSVPIDVSSQRISDLFSEITEIQRNLFYQKWSSHVQENDYLALDTTSISTYSMNIEQAQFGKPKQELQNKKLKQTNLCLLFAENSGLPAYCCTYYGSLNDVSLLIDAVQRYTAIHKNNFKLVLDRGFFSKKNLFYMLDSKPRVKFIVGLPATTSLKNQLVDENQGILFDINYAINTPTDIVYGVSKRILWFERYLYAHIYIDTNKFRDSLDNILKDFIKIYNEAMENPEKHINNKDYTDFFRFRKSSKSKNGYTITKKQAAFKKALERAGWFIFLSDEIKNPEDAIKIYRKRDVVEKAYNIFKNRTDHGRIRVHNDLNNENKLFLGFLALILTSSIHETMLKQNLYKSYSIKEIFKILNGIKITKTSNYSIVSALTAKQKAILDAFNCPHPEKLLFV
jgi:transposase